MTEIVWPLKPKIFILVLTAFRGGGGVKAGMEVGCTFLNKDISGITLETYKTVQAFH